MLHRTLLATSLGAPTTQDIPLESIDTVRVSEPTPTGFGALDLGAAGTIAFAPHQDPQAVARAISAAQRGEAPSATATIPGLDFTAVDVETANDNWGSICQIGAVRFRDGQETGIVLGDLSLLGVGGHGGCGRATTRHVPQPVKDPRALGVSSADRGRIELAQGPSVTARLFSSRNLNSSAALIPRTSIRSAAESHRHSPRLSGQCV